MKDFKELLIEAGALVHGHFVYASGKHGEWYVNKTAGLVMASHGHTYANRIAQLAHPFSPEVVVGPELGAIVLMADVRMALYTREGFDIAGVIATKIPGTTSFEIGRDQARFVKSRRVLVVEDILTTGENAKQTIAAVRKVGGCPVALAALWNRGGVKAEEVNIPRLFSLVNEQIVMYSARECPLCAAWVPVNTDLGRGAEFLAEQKK